MSRNIVKFLLLFLQALLEIFVAAGVGNGGGEEVVVDL
jgi:hypothetical protein